MPLYNFSKPTDISTCPLETLYPQPVDIDLDLDLDLGKPEVVSHDLCGINARRQHGGWCRRYRRTSIRWCLQCKLEMLSERI